MTNGHLVPVAEVAKLQDTAEFLRIQRLGFATSVAFALGLSLILNSTISAQTHRPNVLLIVSEDNGAEVGCYGDPYVKTPHLDQLAADGCRFANAYVTHAVCSVSRASFLTGLYPFQNGHIGLATHQYAMCRNWDNIPSILKQHGYRTGMVGKLHVNPESAFPLDYRAITSSGFNDRPMRKYADAAGKFIHASDQPFFLAVNFPDAHYPLLRQQYGLPEKPLTKGEVKSLPFIGVNSERLRQGAADYYNCLMRLDTGVGMVLEELEKSGKADDTLVIYIGDHGAQFSRGKATCFEGGLRIPMIVRWPGQAKPGTVRDELVSTIDILPTIIQASSLPARVSLPGRSLLPLAANRDVAWRKYLFAERTAYSAASFFPQRTIRDERYKLILNLMPELENPVAQTYLTTQTGFFLYGTNQQEIDGAPEEIKQVYTSWRKPPTVELYDLKNDPWEFRNLADQKELAEVKKRLLGELQSFRERYNDPLLDTERLNKLAAEHDYVAANLHRGRYAKGERWKYLDYLYGDDVGLRIDFEAMPAGEFTIIKNSTGSWQAADGHAVVHTAHSRSGVQSLRVNGGKERQIEWTPPIVDENPDRLEFWFERWTRRTPWEFRVEAFVDDNWLTLHHDTSKAVIGSFHNRLSLKLGDDVPTKFRFTCTAPENTGVMIDDIRLGRGEYLEPPPTGTPKRTVDGRVEIDLFYNRMNGAANYRIPSLAVTKNGTLLAVCDRRKDRGGDAPNNIDQVIRRSADNGETWSDVRAIVDFPGKRTAGDPSLTIDRETGTIWLCYVYANEGVGLAGGQNEQGYGDDTFHIHLRRSDDDGLTWSEPIDISRQIKPPEWFAIWTAPGVGIQTRDGRLMICFSGRKRLADGKWTATSNIAYSDDHGKTWRSFKELGLGTNESQIVELDDGSYMINMRQNGGRARQVSVSKDRGQTWSKQQPDKTLIEPSGCQASLLRLTSKANGDDRNRLLFCNPASTQGRKNMTMRLSYDEGKTWPIEKVIYVGPSAYSCLAVLPNGKIGLLYERDGRRVTYTSFTLEWLSDGKDKLVLRSMHQIDPTEVASELQLARPFGDHMVLQQNVELPVWGKAAPKERVVVQIGKVERKTISDANGNWRVIFPKLSPGDEPDKIEVRSERSSLVVRDVLVGEVWLCAGQSNMEWPLSKAATAKQALAAADNPNIRLFNLQGVARGGSGRYTTEHLKKMTAADFCDGTWQVCSPDSAASFSAVGYFFGEKLQRELEVPVGLINVSIGGTPAESWVRRQALESHPQLNSLVARNWLVNEKLGEWCRERAKLNLSRAMKDGDAIPSDDLGPNHSFKPGFMWQAAVAPLIPFPVHGVVWYQGESNAQLDWRVRQHESIFKLLVTDWRQQFGIGEFPFLYVQLPGMGRPNWPEFRDQQRRLLDRLPNVGMAVTIDVGHPTNVHPSTKKPVGERLACWTLVNTYHRKEFIAAGPLYRSMRISDQSGVLEFDHVGSGLCSSDGQPLRHFEVAGVDGVFHSADAKIESATVVVSSKAVSAPKHVRYAWTPYPKPAVNFFNRDGQPASPFSTAGKK